MTKREEMDAARRGQGCLGKSKDDEPVFILCGRDPLAGMTVRVWAEAYRERHRGDMFMTDAQKSKYQEALDHAKRLDEWASRQ